MVAGTVSVDASGVVTGSGAALVIYNGIYAQESSTDDWPDPDQPPDDYVGTAADWKAAITESIVNLQKSFARTANGIAPLITYVQANAQAQVAVDAIAVGIPTVAKVLPIT